MDEEEEEEEEEEEAGRPGPDILNEPPHTILSIPGGRVFPLALAYALLASAISPGDPARDGQPCAS